MIIISGVSLADVCERAAQFEGRHAPFKLCRICRVWRMYLR